MSRTETAIDPTCRAIARRAREIIADCQRRHNDVHNSIHIRDDQRLIVELVKIGDTELRASEILAMAQDGSFLEQLFNPAWPACQTCEENC